MDAKHLAIFQMLSKQRDSAMNDLALMAGELAERDAKIAELEAKIPADPLPG